MSPGLLAALIQALRERPDDVVTKKVLADALDEAGPTPVELHELPNWLRLAWRRCAAPGRYRRHLGASGYAVVSEIRELLSEGRNGFFLDHWGRTEIAGLLCFVTEPYCEAEEAPDLLAPLRQVVPGMAIAYCMQSHWGAGSHRAVAFPPLVMPPPRRRKK